MTTTVHPDRAQPTVVGLAVLIEPTVENVGDLRIHLTGELDAWSAPTLTHAVAGLQPPSPASADHRARIVLDLHELSFLDTGGLTALQDSREALRADGWLVTAGPSQPQVCRLLRFADRAGWLIGGPLAAEQSSASHVHAMPTSADCRRRPRSVSAVSAC
jgi:anti-anti-sigma factor